MKYQNPFKPTAGKMPPVLVGCDKVINDFIEGLETAISGLPKTAIEFILAMSETGTVTAVGEIAKRLGKTTGYLSPYRRQLISRQIIEQTAPGYVTFSIPFMREFLIERKGGILARYGE